MKVIINDELYNSTFDEIVLILTKVDKYKISQMKDDQMVYALK